MGKLHTHYDNLKVSRDAPIGVIKAAYKTLAQTEHPDRSTKPDATRRMQLINDAYAALTDPTKRAEHDNWIKKNEKHSTPNPSVKTHSVEEKINQLRQLHRSDLHQLRQQHAVEANKLKGSVKFYRHFGLILGVLVSIPIHFFLSHIGQIISLAHAQ